MVPFITYRFRPILHCLWCMGREFELWRFDHTSSTQGDIGIKTVSVFRLKCPWILTDFGQICSSCLAWTWSSRCEVLVTPLEWQAIQRWKTLSFSRVKCHSSLLYPPISTKLLSLNFHVTIFGRLAPPPLPHVPYSDFVNCVLNCVILAYTEVAAISIHAGHARCDPIWTVGEVTGEKQTYSRKRKFLYIITDQKHSNLRRS
jgi:hypothetical protein